MQKLIKQKPKVHNQVVHFWNKAVKCIQARDYIRATKFFKKVIALNPNLAEAHCNLGLMLNAQDKLDEAIASYGKAIKLKPDHVEAHNNLGNALKAQGKPDEAITSYDKAIKLKPDYVALHFNRAFVLLLTEKFPEGWVEYEWRLRLWTSFRQPKWDGLPLNGKSILIYTEGGFGDTIQFMRYFPMVKAQGGYVIFECQRELIRLLRNYKGFDEIIERTPRPNTQSDVYTPLMSLAGIFNTNLNNIPEIPNITLDTKLVSHWENQLSSDRSLKIGIVWAGSPKHDMDRPRSCSLADFAPLADIPDLTFYSLQKGEASKEAFNPPKNMKFINLENKLNDFTDTAGVIANLDLVISVDTAVAHLAGALGKPVWTLLRFAPCWRWLLNRDDSPWYPSMRLFRQTRPNGWTGVFERVKEEMLDWYRRNYGKLIRQDI